MICGAFRGGEVSQANAELVLSLGSRDARQPTGDSA
jgi:hypothetical protein